MRQKGPKVGVELVCLSFSSPFLFPLTLILILTLMYALTWKHSGGGSLDSREETAAGIGNRPPGTVFIPIPLLVLGLNGVICLRSGLTMVASRSSSTRLDGCPAPPPPLSR